MFKRMLVPMMKAMERGWVFLGFGGRHGLGRFVATTMMRSWAAATRIHLWGSVDKCIYMNRKEK
jgi:hypothetical protein